MRTKNSSYFFFLLPNFPIFPSKIPSNQSAATPPPPSRLPPLRINQAFWGEKRGFFPFFAFPLHFSPKFRVASPPPVSAAADHQFGGQKGKHRLLRIGHKKRRKHSEKMHFRRTNCIIFSSIQRPSPFLKCFATSSTQFAQQQQSEAQEKMSAEEEKKKKRADLRVAFSNLMNIVRVPFLGRRGRRHTVGKFDIPPTGLAIVDPQGGAVHVDMDIPVGELLKDAPDTLRSDFKKLSSEINENSYGGRFAVANRGMWTNRGKDIYEFASFAEHGEAFIEYQFKTDEDFDNWQTGSDSDSAEGYSKCDLYRSDRGTAIFEGVISNRVVKDGRTDRAGWCSMITVDLAAFGRKRRYDEWEPYNHLLIKCRGDGRTYKVMLHWPSYHDVSWGFSHSCYLHTHGGPYWQFETIPFSRFFFTSGGRIQDTQCSVPIVKASKIGIVLMDRIEGPFRLEIDFIGVMHDITHDETFAYETYNTKLLNPAM